jgi:hypothetical protein
LPDRFLTGQQRRYFNISIPSSGRAIGIAMNRSGGNRIAGNRSKIPASVCLGMYGHERGKKATE